MSAGRRFLMPALLAASLGAIAAPASAEDKVRWASRSGVQSGSDCLQPTQPCTMSNAIAWADAGDTVRCLDGGPFGELVVGKSVRIECLDRAASVSRVSIQGTNAQVVLRGLVIDGGHDGIITPTRGNSSLTIEDSVIRRSDLTAAPYGNGLSIAPESGTLNVLLRRTEITGQRRLGIYAVASGSEIVRLTVDGSSLSGNSGGIRAETLGSGKIDLAVIDSVVSGNASHGVIVESPSGTTVRATIKDSALVNNSLAGLRVMGAGATVLLGNTAISGKVIGTEVTDGGRLFSYGDNQINNNDDNGPNPSVIVKK